MRNILLGLGTDMTAKFDVPKITRGPWFSGFTIRDGARCIVGDGDSVVCEFRDRSGSTLEADARLIAVAPDLLEACIQLIEAESPKQCFQNRKETEARQMIRDALARIGGAA